MAYPERFHQLAKKVNNWGRWGPDDEIGTINLITPEVRRRASRLLARWAAPASAEYPAGQARELRAVWALELAGTPEAKKLLEGWAGAGVGERLCEAADAALKRLRRSAR